MAKYLVTGAYSVEGVQGLAKDKASGRKAAVQAAIKSLGGKVEGFYYMFGSDDVVVLVDLPDNVAAAAMSARVQRQGYSRPSSRRRSAAAA